MTSEAIAITGAYSRALAMGSPSLYPNLSMNWFGGYLVNFLVFGHQLFRISWVPFQ